MKDIDENMDDIIKEKQELEQEEINMSQYQSKINDGTGAYLYSKDDIDNMERINQSLMKVQPMLMPSENESDYQSSVIKSRIGDKPPSYD